MKWFKHDTDARQDFKLKRLIKRFGIEGYGVYWAIIELLAFETKDNLDVRLSLNSFPVEDIAHDLGIDSGRLSEILGFMAEVGLIDPDMYSDNILHCKALSRRADDYSARQGRGVRRVEGLSRTESEHSSNQVLLEEKRGEERRGEEKIREDITAVWNSTDLPKILSWSSVRLTCLRRRTKDPQFVEKYREAIQRLSRSDFALGKGPPRNPGEKPWTATIDWFLENDNNYLKTLEGKYDNKEADMSEKYLRQRK